MKDKPLTVEIKDGELQISIGIDTLCFAVSEKIADFKITDNEGFVKDILNELENEDEEGTTEIHRLLDQAADDAVENGSCNGEIIDN